MGDVAEAGIERDVDDAARPAGLQPRPHQVEPRAGKARLAAQPRIAIPTIAPHGETDGIGLVAASASHHRRFTGPYERRVYPRVGHNPPQEAPEAFARAVLDLPAT